MNFKVTSRDFKFFIIGVLTLFLAVIIYDWDHFEKGLLGTDPNDTAKTENVE